jgi:hypothetical protein
MSYVLQSWSVVSDQIAYFLGGIVHSSVFCFIHWLNDFSWINSLLNLWTVNFSLMQQLNQAPKNMPGWNSGSSETDNGVWLPEAVACVIVTKLLHILCWMILSQLKDPAWDGQCSSIHWHQSQALQHSKQHKFNKFNISLLIQYCKPVISSKWQDKENGGKYLSRRIVLCNSAFLRKSVVFSHAKATYAKQDHVWK